MSLKIGRVGIDVPSNDPEVWTEQGEVVTFSGRTPAASVADAKTLRQQILGYPGNPWEKVVPVVWSVDTSRSGYYIVQDATVDTRPETLAGGWVPITARLQRVQGFNYPAVDFMLQGQTRVGTPGGVTPSYWHAVPSTFSGYVNPGAPSNTYATRAAAGSITMRVYADASNADNTANPAAAGVNPSNFYDGAATLYAGGYVVVGRQIPSIGNETNWRVDNGLLRVAPGSTSMLSLSCYDGAAWSTPYDVHVFSAFIGNITAAPRSITVLENGPERVALRLAVPIVPVANGSGSINVDIVLRRGSRYAEIYLSTFNGSQWGLACSTTTALTTVDANGGAHRASAAVTTPRIVLGSGTTVTWDDTNGKVYATSVNTTTADFLLGYEVGGTAATAIDTAVKMRDQYFAALSEMQIVVAQ